MTTLKGMEKKQPTSLEIAILKTLLYADLFDYPLTLPEIHHYLIGSDASLQRVQSVLESSDWLAGCVIRVNGYYATCPEAADLRHRREHISAKLWKRAHRYGRWIAYLPFVRMVALTGALAMRNADHEHDDLDYLIVTAMGRVWLTRLLVVMLVRAARLWGVQLCPNYMLSDAQLEQQRKDLYIAHELAQMVPISGYSVYLRMREENRWLYALLPNACDTFYPIKPHQVRGLGLGVQRLLEWLLSGRVGDALECWEHRRKAAKFAQEAAQSPYSSAVINAEQIKGHFNDYGHPIIARYYDRLRDYGIELEKDTA